MARPQQQGKQSILQKRNWYEDRFQSAVVQRNVLLLIVMLALAGVVFGVLTVYQISASKKIFPFVIQVDSKTGITNVVQPLETYSTNENVQKYFVMKYMNARETYSFYDFRYQYYTVVRLLSSDAAYQGFRRFLASDSPDVPLRYGERLSRNIAVESLNYIPTSNTPGVYTMQVRFKVLDMLNGHKQPEKHKVAILSFKFAPTLLTNDEQYVNPLGFEIISYRVDDEIQ